VESIIIGHRALCDLHTTAEAAKKGVPMATHRVRMTVPGFDIGGANVEFVIESTRRTASGELEKLGELHISKGSLEWWPKGAKRYRREVKWENFAEWIEANGRRF
jgi:hypothetical protein